MSQRPQARIVLWSSVIRCMIERSSNATKLREGPQDRSNWRRWLSQTSFGQVFYTFRSGDSLPADVLWGSFVTHSFLPHGRSLGEKWMRDERTLKNVCGEDRVEINQEDWRPMWPCACFGGDPIYIGRPSKKETIEIWCKKSSVFENGKRPRFHRGKLSYIDGELYQAWDVWAVNLQ